MTDSKSSASSIAVSSSFMTHLGNSAELSNTTNATYGTNATAVLSPLTKISRLL